MKKKMRRILYFDDSDGYLEALRKSHGNYCIIHKKDIKELPVVLESLEGTSDWPDILLLDVYWPNEANTSSQISFKAEEAEKILINEVQPAIDKLNDIYTSAFSPQGIEYLKNIREKYGPDRLPIVMYTSKGHFLLRKYDWLRIAMESKAEWVSKGTASSHVEALVFDRAIENARRLNPKLRDLLKQPLFRINFLSSIVVSLLVGLLAGILLSIIGF